MSQLHRWFVLTLLAVALATQVPGLAEDCMVSPVRYKGVVSYKFSAIETEALIKGAEWEKLRLRAWQLFAAINEEDPSSKLPIWTTWYDKDDEVLAPIPKADRSSRVSVKSFENRQQHVVQPRADAFPSQVLFSREACVQIRGNSLFDVKEFLGGRPKGIESFPQESVVLKTAWGVLKPRCGGMLPVFDRETAYGMQLAWAPPGWRTAVRLLPKGGSQQGCPLQTSYDLVRREIKDYTSSFYWLEATDEDVISLKAMSTGVWKLSGDAAPVEKGDVLILLGMHVTTKEAKRWAWSTFWWHDHPTDLPFGGDRISSVKGKWANYRMDVAFDPVEPQETKPYGSTPHNSAFNPYLEAALTAGVSSNCVGCHQKAMWCGNQLPTPVQGVQMQVDVGTNQINSTMSQMREQLDTRMLPVIPTTFLWSLAMQGTKADCKNQ